MAPRQPPGSVSTPPLVCHHCLIKPQFGWGGGAIYHASPWQASLLYPCAFLQAFYQSKASQITEENCINTVPDILGQTLN